MRRWGGGVATEVFCSFADRQRRWASGGTVGVFRDAPPYLVIRLFTVGLDVIVTGMDTRTRLRWTGYGFLAGVLATTPGTPFPLDTFVFEYQVRNFVVLTSGGIGGAIVARFVLWLRTRLSGA